MRWHEPARLFDLCTVVGMSRPGVSDFGRVEWEWD